MTDQPLSSTKTDFTTARREAALQDILDRLRGQQDKLLSFNEVQKHMKGVQGPAHVLKEIPLDAIVGSVGRYSDFNRNFLPRQDSDQERWERVMKAMDSPKNLPPIDVYQIGEVYFVADGNHRVSISRFRQKDTIQAYVTEIETRVPLTTGDQAEDVIRKSEYIDFLERTEIDVNLPEVTLHVTAAGKYPALLQQIEGVHQQLKLSSEQVITFKEAALYWYEEIYLPIQDVIQARHLLRAFPNRTETDLFLCLVERQSELENELGWEVQPEDMALEFAEQFSPEQTRAQTRLRKKIKGILRGRDHAAGHKPGDWREDKLSLQQGRMFNTLLVILSQAQQSWTALDQGLAVAQNESGRIFGLHIQNPNGSLPPQERVDLEAGFNARCESAGVPGNLVFEAGVPASILHERSRWADLVIASPPQGNGVSREFHQLIEHSHTPFLTAPSCSHELKHGLLAYDGSPKANEALFMAAYLANFWGIELTLAMGVEKGTGEETVITAVDYLEARNVKVQTRVGDSPAHEFILGVAEEEGVDLLLMGGFHRKPVRGSVLGGTVDQVLNQIGLPVMICR